MGPSQPAIRCWELLLLSHLDSLPGCWLPNTEGSRITLVPDCASPCGWESPEGGGKQRGRTLKGSAVHQLLSRPAPSLSPAGFLLPASRATTMKRRASDSESSVCRIRLKTADGNGLSQQSQVASGPGARDSYCLLGPGSNLGSVLKKAKWVRERPSILSLPLQRAPSLKSK